MVKPSSNKSFLQQGNAALQRKEFSLALSLYEKAKAENPELSEIINENILYTQRAIGTIIPKKTTSNKLEDSTIADVKIARRNTTATPSSTPIKHVYQSMLEASQSKLAAQESNTTYLIDSDNAEFITGIIRLILATFNLKEIIISTSLDTAKLNSGLSAKGISLSTTHVQFHDSILHYLVSDGSKSVNHLCLISPTSDSEFGQLSAEQQTIFISTYFLSLAERGRANTIAATFGTHPNLAIIGIADFYLSVKKEQHDDILSNILQATSPQLDAGAKWAYFHGGPIWVSAKTYGLLATVCEKIAIAMIDINKHDQNLIVYKALALLAKTSNKDTALIYESAVNDLKIDIFLSSDTTNYGGSNFPIAAILQNLIDFSKNMMTINEADFFSESFYLKAYPYASKLGGDSLAHFLRYGLFENLNPNPDFSVNWYWEQHKSMMEPNQNPVIHRINNKDTGLFCTFPAQENMTAIMELVSSAGIFDEDYYRARNEDVSRSKMTPFFHFCRYGWQELRAPCPSQSFDLIWYAANYLDNWATPINPLLHFVLAGAQVQAENRPTLRPMSPPYSYNKQKVIRRICLFAGYDSDGLIDDYVVNLISELSLYSDVFYLADSDIHETELFKLKTITKGAWAYRHQEYDFGSYARLAHNLVGWNEISKYDELLLVNDSSYLIKPLNQVFKKMDSKPCDWWGLQATKGTIGTRDFASNKFTNPISMKTVVKTMLPDFENDEVYDFHIGSYFLTFRKPCLAVGGVLHKLLKDVRKEKNKKNIIFRYEVALTRYMLLAGHQPATFIDNLYPLHPIYTERHFELIKQGFPLLKRFLLSENHYNVPQLQNWKARIASILPQSLLALQTAEQNLLRITNSEKLYRTLNVPKDGSVWPKPLLTDKEFIREDSLTLKDDWCWAFPVCAFDHLLTGNERMLFEAVKDNGAIRKIVLTRDKNIDVGGINVTIVPLKSREGQELLMEAKYIFIKHTAWRNTIYPLDSKQHRFINLWHGIPLKRIGYTSLDMADNLDALAIEHAKCHAVIASSKIDRLAMTAAFYPLTYHDVWLTGLPRNDAILRRESALPDNFRKQISKLRQALSGRKLILFAPTFRNGQADAYYDFTAAECEELAACLSSQNAVLGVREHMADKAHSYSTTFKNSNVPTLDLARSHFADIELLYREAEVLITDYSSCFIDFMLTGKPEICFAYDYESYAGTERGLFYDLASVFPGPICKNAKTLIEALSRCLAGEPLESTSSYESKRSMFFEYVDDKNTDRLLSCLEHEIRPSSTISAFNPARSA